MILLKNVESDTVRVTGRYLVILGSLNSSALYRSVIQTAELSPMSDHSFCTTQEIVRLIKGLDVSKANGPEWISACMLKPQGHI